MTKDHGLDHGLWPNFIKNGKERILHFYYIEVIPIKIEFLTGTCLLWFFRDYGNATITDYIELRVCGNEAWSNEDTPVQLYEIYVK